MRWRAAVVALACLAGACADQTTESGALRTPGPTASTLSTTSTSPSSTTTTTSTTVVPLVAAQAATPTCPAVPARANPDPKRPRYTLTMDVKPAQNVVDGRLEVRFTPDLATDQLVFRLWPNGPKLRQAGATLDVGPVAVDGKAPQPGRIPDPTTLVVPLGGMRPAGRTITASLPWKLTLPRSTSDRIARSGDTVRLGSFFPILAWDPGVGWGRQPPTSNFAEAGVSPTADFDLRITVPAGLQAVPSGVATGPGRWEALAVRDVAVSVGRFRTVEGRAGPVKVTVAVANELREDPRTYLGTVVRAIDDFARRFGPYPWPVYTLAITPNLNGGIEYPMHVLQGPGTQGRTTPHEVAHMWFYGLVGNDQGRDPWLDEGLASYAEARFLGATEAFRTRSIPADARGRTGARMAYWDGRSSYYRGVYVQGAQALLALGPLDRIDCALRHHVARNAFGVAQPADLLASLEAVFPAARSVLERYGAI